MSTNVHDTGFWQKNYPDRSVSLREEGLKARVIAFYLPQFHPIPENNEWWGPGFTEWTNVTKAKKLYSGHYQPRLPADLGFYDLRVPETREQQAALAIGAGVEGFCYWHYWFGNGRRIIERPFQEVLSSGKPDFPFCLAWANQSWTGIWHGDPGRTLVEQSYLGLEDFKAHFECVLPAFLDQRYIKVDGRPVFVIFDPLDLKNTKQFTDYWRSLAVEAGLPGICFVGLANQHDEKVLAPFDMLADRGLGNFYRSLPQTFIARALRRIKRRDFGRRVNHLFGSVIGRPQRFSYEQLVSVFIKHKTQDERYVPCVLPNWDNTPRSGIRGVVFDKSTPSLFAKILSHALEQVKHKPPQERIIFLKSWNEWAEGNYVEPDRRFGRAYLNVIRDHLKPSNQ